MSDPLKGVANQAVFSMWRAKLAEPGSERYGVGSPAAVQQAGEIAALLEIRSALVEERFDDAADLIDNAVPLVHAAHMAVGARRPIR